MSTNHQITILSEDENDLAIPSASLEPPPFKKIRIAGADSSSGSSIADLPSLPIPPRTLSIPPPSDLFSRLSTFLPQLQAANASLEEDILTGKITEKNIENIGENEEQYIEMNLGLGVLEEKKPKSGRRHQVRAKGTTISELEPADIIPRGDSDSSSELSSSYFSSSSSEGEEDSEDSSSEEEEEEEEEEEDSSDDGNNSEKEENEEEELEGDTTKENLASGGKRLKHRPKLRAKSVLAKLLNMQQLDGDGSMKKIIIEEIPHDSGGGGGDDGSK